MKKLTLFIIFLNLGIAFTFGQSANDTIVLKRAFGGYQYFQGEKKLNMSQLVNIMQPNEKAYEQIKSAQSSLTFAMIFSYAGGFMVGYPIGTAIGGGEPNWKLAGIGLGLIVISIPLNQSAMKKTNEAVNLYNSGFRSSSSLPKAELHLSSSKDGIGLRLKF